MPIKPENKHLYPDNWQEIRTTILKRANAMCELCFLPDGEMVYRNDKGQPMFWFPGIQWKGIKVQLTIAHIDQNPTNNDPNNLLALCQRCHNRIDLPYRQKNAAATRAAKAAAAKAEEATREARRTVKAARPTRPRPHTAHEGRRNVSQV